MTLQSILEHKHTSPSSGYMVQLLVLEWSTAAEIQTEVLELPWRISIFTSNISEANFVLFYSLPFILLLSSK